MHEGYVFARCADMSTPECICCLQRIMIMSYIYFKKHVLDNYGDTIKLCPSYGVNTSLKCAFHQIIA